MGNLSDIKSPALYTALLAELLGVMFLVVVACGSCAGISSTVQISLCFALAIATLVWNTCRVSGGHLNPAVTVAMLVTRRITLVRATLYVAVQMLGALLGAAILLATMGDVKNAKGKDFSETLGVSSPSNPDTALGAVFGIELLITFVLVWTVFATCDSRRTDLAGSGPLAIGLSIGMCHLWAVPITGSGMNPARVFGPAVVSGVWTHHWAYWVAPIVGGIAAGLIYDFLFAVNATRSKLRAFVSKDYDDSNFNQSGRYEPGTQDDAQNASALPLKETP